jgi:DNA N-6-adenine-methyltransferase (Dam)
MAHDEWYTPKEIIDPIREFYGGKIDYDPASCEKANEVIQAKEFHWLEHHLNSAQPYIASYPFLDNIWINPPYCNGAAKSWIECACEFSLDRDHSDKQIVMLVNRSDARWYYDFLDKHNVRSLHRGGYYQFRKRIKFVDGLTGKPSSPRYNNDLIYFGKNGFRFQLMCILAFGKPTPTSF